MTKDVLPCSSLDVTVNVAMRHLMFSYPDSKGETGKICFAVLALS